MKRKLCIVLFIIFGAGIFSTYSQQVAVSVATYFPLAGSSNSNSLCIDYIHPLKDNFKWQAGIEAGLVPWGTDITANAGILYSKNFATKWSWLAGCSTAQGFALFKPSVLYVWGLTGIAGIEHHLSSRSTLALSTGLRYTACPEYKNYSLIADYWSVPVVLTYKINFK